ncbi:methionine--tRNA ligase [Candidatus Roizmanbacteria bacterium]|jgi:methionyl-tRNA synthetase|nr:methionine--tRNA ligase [Candidatus Roizmanbacteria bacterium]
MKKKVFIGVAWPYVNGILHVGHLAGYLLPADICARYNKLVGNKVLMASGSDCFGTPITVEADKKKKQPKEVVAEYHKRDSQLFKKTLHLSYDIYTKTDHPHHIKVVQEVFLKLLEKGLLFINEADEYYSPSEKRFLPDRYVVGQCPHCGFSDARSDQCDNCGKLLEQGELKNPRSNLSKTPVVLKKSKHYFIDWPKLQNRIETYVKPKKDQWKTWVYNETMGWLKEGLKPRATTRNIDWGVPIPYKKIPKNMLIEDVKNKRLYVWFDAVIGYLSASKLWGKTNKKNWKEFWYGKNLKHYYFMGKDNLVFHTIFWPGKLMIYDPKIHLPDVPSINMFLDFDKKKFSKSRGVIVDIKEIVEKFGNDRVRFYLTFIMPELKDSSFIWLDFQKKVNGILVANLGNFIHRVLSLGRGLDKEKFDEIAFDREVKKQVTDSFGKAKDLLDRCQFRNYLSTVLDLSTYGNSLVDKEQVWTLKKNDKDRFIKIMKQLYLIVISLGYLMLPLLPEGGDRLFKTLKVKTPDLWPEKNKEIPALTKILNKASFKDRPQPLFSKIEDEEI